MRLIDKQKRIYTKQKHVFVEREKLSESHRGCSVLHTHIHELNSPAMCCGSDSEAESERARITFQNEQLSR